IDWLLTGRGEAPEAMPSLVPLMGYVGAGAEVEPDFEQVPEEGMEQIEVPFPLPADMIALQVRGDSMLPQFRNGVIIIVYREQRRSKQPCARLTAAASSRRSCAAPPAST
ncbi:S24 family peptidase, partial [Streptococcus suis]|uniref:S24 family peptidase n=1 Tax=Streptococcus suis TaxID=1307 RepID=UPI001EE4DC93